MNGGPPPGYPGLPTEPIPQIEGFQIVGELGRGGMGVVYRAMHAQSGQTVALKVLPVAADQMLLSRFSQEIQIARMLDHPSIVRVYDAGFGQSHAWIAMEVLDGFELWEAMPDTRFTLEERVGVIARVAIGLHHAHEQGIVHRDVKPSNIFLTRDGRVRLLDFGVAKLRNVRLTKTGKTVGTPQYMAPEQIQAQTVDARTDVFALGAVAYEVLTGVPPWAGENDHQLMMAICTRPPRPFTEAFNARNWWGLAPHALKNLQRVVHTALTTEPSRRQQTMLEFAEGIERFMVAGASEEMLAEIPGAKTKGWSEQRIDWAQARAARIRVESVSAPPAAPEGAQAIDGASGEVVSAVPETRGDDDDEAKDSSVVVWVVLCAVFAIGLVIASISAFG